MEDNKIDGKTVIRVVEDNRGNAVIKIVEGCEVQKGLKPDAGVTPPINIPKQPTTDTGSSSSGGNTGGDKGKK